MPNNNEITNATVENAVDAADVQPVEKKEEKKGDGYTLVHKDGRRAEVRDAIQAAPFVRAGYQFKGKGAPDWLKELLDAKENAGTI